MQRPIVYKDPDESDLRSHTLPLVGIGRRLVATVRFVHQQGEVREITREAGQSESSSLLSTPRGRKFTRKAIHPVKRGRTKIAVCTRHFGTSAHERFQPIRKVLADAPTNRIRGTNLSRRNNFILKKEEGMKKTIVGLGF